MKDPLLEEMAQVLQRHGLLDHSTAIGVAVSGGADSVVLLHLLHRLGQQFPLRLSVVHVNHQLRGAESEADEASVRDLAARLGLDVHVFQEPVAVQAAGENLEQAARDARRRVFASLREKGMVSRIALGHTQSDQAETVLFRLLRGAGLPGLSGMRELSPDGLLRPLLRVTREQVREWARLQGIAWREDSSNSDRRFRRNLIRNELLPQIRTSLNGGVERVLAGMAEIAQAEEDYWREVVDRHFPRFAEPDPVGLIGSVAFLREQPLALQRRLLRRAFELVKSNLRELDSSHVEAVLRICNSSAGHDRVLLPGVDALRSFDALLLAAPGEINRGKRHYRRKIVTNELIDLPGQAGKIRVDVLTERFAERQNCVKFVNEKNPPEVIRLDPEALGGTNALDELVIRNWEPGDQYQPAGHQSAKKIKQLFQEHQIYIWERRHWPVLELRDEIVWARRFGPAGKFRAEQDRLPAVSLTYIAPPESNVLISTSEKVVGNIPGGRVGQAGKVPASER